LHVAPRATHHCGGFVFVVQEFFNRSRCFLHMSEAYVGASLRQWMLHMFDA
jgi:hypothetical protein